MPVRNEASFIERSLGAVLAQDYPTDRMEVLVVDGNSEDGTASIAERLARSTGDIAVRVLANPAGTVPHGLNLALSEARGEVIVRVDGHCVVGRDYLRRCVDELAKTGAACVGGTVRTVGDKLVGRAIAAAQGSRFGVGGVAFRTGARRAGPVDTVAFGAYRRDVFTRLGAFDPELVRNQDDEFNYRLANAGEIVWLDPSIVTTYFSRTTLTGLWRQYYEYGLFKVRVFQKRGRVHSIRQLAPPAFVVGVVGASVLSVATRSLLWVSVVLGPYLAASVLASLVTGRADRAVIPLLPLVYATLHVAYGLGMLHGMWQWRKYFRIGSLKRREAS